MRPRHPQQSDLRGQVIRMLSQWWDERGISESGPENALAALRETPRMPKGKGVRVSARGVESRPSGRSVPPVRDMSRQSRQIDEMIRQISDFDRNVSRAIEAYAVRTQLGDVMDVMRCSKATAFRLRECGMFALMAMVSWGNG